MTIIGSGPWLRRFHPKRDVVGRLVCLPHAGGAASYFHPLSRLMSELPIDVIVVQYPGRQDRAGEPLIDDVGVLADRVADALVGWTDQPFVFLGHSMGATVAFETSRRLAETGVAPTCLFASARRAPSIHRPEPVAQLGDRELLAEVMSLDGAGSQVLADPEIIAMVLPAIRNDYSAIAGYRYRPGPALTCPIVALVGESDDKVSRADALAWAEHTTGPFELRSFAGGHFYLDEHRDAIRQLVVDRLPTA